VIGQCLCGEVQFEISGSMPDFYQCHCSLCQKLTGSGSDTATFLNKAQFKWSKPNPDIKSYKTSSGYRSDFCQQCGSTVPYFMENGEQYWIPAGLLNQPIDNVVAAHLFVESKAPWDVIGDNGTQYDEMPPMNELNETLQKGKS
jgi:hypothetical protein